MHNNIDFKFIIPLMILLIIIYRTYFREIRTYEEYISRSVSYKMIFKKEKANRVLIDALKEKEFSKYEMCGLLTNISENYYLQKDYDNSITYFEKALDLIKDEKFVFNDYYIKMIKCYLDQNQKQKAVDLYDDLALRRSYSDSFKKIESIKYLLERD